MKIVNLLIPVLFLTFPLFGQQALINKIEDQYKNFNYENVISLSGEALKDYADLSKAQLIKIYTLRGVAYYSLADEDSARLSFINILKLNENYEIDSLIYSPKIISFFNKVKTEYEQIAGLNTKDEKEKQPAVNAKPQFYRQRSNIFNEAMARSIILPGWGHLYAGEKTKGFILTSASAITLGSMIYYILKTNSNYTDYLNATDAASINKKYDQYNSSYKIRNILIAAYSALWIYAQSDLLFISKSTTSEQMQIGFSPGIFSKDPVSFSFYFHLPL